MKSHHMKRGDAGDDMSNATEMSVNERLVDDFTIGDLAREFDVTLRALRFYEARGLLKPRRVGLTRFYGAECRARLALILKGKSLGFTLQEIRDLLAEKSRQGDASNKLNLNLTQVEEQLETLRRQKIELDVAIAELEHTRQRLLA
jgi:DNA-binding transcriptional MerR regulator